MLENNFSYKLLANVRVLLASGGKDPLKAGSGCPSLTLEDDSQIHGENTNLQPKVQNLHIEMSHIIYSY